MIGEDVKRRMSVVLAVLFGLSFVPEAVAERARIRPLKETVQFSTDCSANSWIGYISNVLGEIEYELVLKPEYDVEQHLLGWDLVLHRADHPSVNLLTPKVWHGLLPAFLRAQDFISGPEKSTFGPDRVFPLKKQRMTVAMRIDDAKVQSQDGAFVFTRLRIVLNVTYLN